MEDQLRHLQTMVEANATRVAVLESMAKASDEVLRRLVRETDGIRETVHRIEVAQAARASVPLCGAPNKCLALEKHLVELAETVQQLVADRAEARGALKATVFWASCVSGLVSVGVSYLAHLIANHKP